MRCFRFVRLLCLALLVAALPASSIAAVPDGASSASPVISGYGQQGEAQRKTIENPVGEMRSKSAQDAKSTTAAGPNSGVRVNAATRHGKVAAHDGWSGDSGAPSSSDSGNSTGSGSGGSSNSGSTSKPSNGNVIVRPKEANIPLRQTPQVHPAPKAQQQTQPQGH